MLLSANSTWYYSITATLQLTNFENSFLQFCPITILNRILLQTTTLALLGKILEELWSPIVTAALPRNQAFVNLVTVENQTSSIIFFCIPTVFHIRNILVNHQNISQCFPALCIVLSDTSRISWCLLPLVKTLRLFQSNHLFYFTALWGVPGPLPLIVLQFSPLNLVHLPLHFPAEVLVFHWQYVSLRSKSFRAFSQLLEFLAPPVIQILNIYPVFTPGSMIVTIGENCIRNAKKIEGNGFLISCKAHFYTLM